VLDHVIGLVVGFLVAYPFYAGASLACRAAGVALDLRDGIATRRLGTPEDIANGVLFFVSDESAWVTGQVLSIDGGHSIF